MMPGTFILGATLLAAMLALVALHRWTQGQRDMMCSSGTTTLQGGMFWLRIVEKGQKIGDLGAQPIFEWMDVALDASESPSIVRLYPHIGEEIKDPTQASQVFLQAGRILYTATPVGAESIANGTLDCHAH